MIAGQYNNGANDKAFVMRLTTAGELDTSFGTGGIKTFDFVADHDEKFNAIAVQGGDMVVAGASGSDLLVARLQACTHSARSRSYEFERPSWFNTPVVVQSSGKVFAPSHERDLVR